MQVPRFQVILRFWTKNENICIMILPRYSATISTSCRLHRGGIKCQSRKATNLPEAKMFFNGDAQKSEIIVSWLFWGISCIIFRSFGAQLRKATHCKQVVRSTLLHLFVQGGPKGKNPGSNISSDLEILNWKLKGICIMILPRYSATIFYKLQASQGCSQFL